MKIALNQMKISQDMRDGFQAFFLTVQVYQAGMYAMIKKDHGVWFPDPFRVSPCGFREAERPKTAWSKR